MGKKNSRKLGKKKSEEVVEEPKRLGRDAYVEEAKNLRKLDEAQLKSISNTTRHSFSK